MLEKEKIIGVSAFCMISFVNGLLGSFNWSLRNHYNIYLRDICQHPGV